MDDLTQLPATARELHHAAIDAMAASYSPYSRYPVGAAVRTASGRIFAGCNVENAAYPLGSCAEAGAIASMVFGGERQIVEVVTVTEGDRPGTPCGGCRQRLREFADASVPVYATTAGGAFVVLTMEQLLPESFGPEFLDVHPVRTPSEPLPEPPPEPPSDRTT